ncbi:hypothetical protein Tco_1216126 [Tanacetum coccineum]
MALWGDPMTPHDTSFGVGIITNGYRFLTRRREEFKKTQNSGVIVEVEGGNYYGKLSNIIELEYFGGYKVVLFHCDWVDIRPSRGLKKDRYGCPLVNFSRPLIHMGVRLQDDHFIISSQARQVFYIDDLKDVGWWRKERDFIFLLQVLPLLKRTKHINVRYHFIREVLETKTVKVLNVGTAHNAADALTKVVPGLKFQHCLELLNVGAIKTYKWYQEPWFKGFSILGSKSLKVSVDRGHFLEGVEMLFSAWATRFNDNEKVQQVRVNS